MSNVISDRLHWDKPHCSYPSKTKERSDDDNDFIFENIVRILWWNIQYGETAKAIQRQSVGCNPLTENLRILAKASHQDSPDILVLAEWEYQSFIVGDDERENDLISLLEESYPYHNFWPYNPETPERGIMIYSKLSYDINNTILLDYYPLLLDKDERDQQQQQQEKIEAYKNWWKQDFPPERFFP